MICPSALLQAGGCSACFHCSLLGRAVVSGSRAQLGFCATGMPPAPVSMLVHELVRVSLAVVPAVSAELSVRTLPAVVGMSWCIHTHPCGQGGVSPQGSSAPLRTHSIWTTERKQKEKGETLEEKGLERSQPSGKALFVCAPHGPVLLVCHLSASLCLHPCASAAQSCQDSAEASGNERGAMSLPCPPPWVGSLPCPSPTSPLQTLWQPISQEDVAALVFQHCQFPE